MCLGQLPPAIKDKSIFKEHEHAAAHHAAAPASLEQPWATAFQDGSRRRPGFGQNVLQESAHRCRNGREYERTENGIGEISGIVNDFVLAAAETQPLSVV